MVDLSIYRRRRLYRSRRGVLMGVCRGLADHFEVSVFWVRVGAIALLMVSGVWPAVLAYVVAGLLLKPEPVLPLSSDGEAEFYNSYADSRPLAIRRLKGTYDDLARRIRRVEDIVTSRDFDWEQRLRSGRRMGAQGSGGQASS